MKDFDKVVNLEVERMKREKGDLDKYLSTLTPEQLETLMRDEKDFHGTVEDKDAKQRFERIEHMVQKLYAKGELSAIGLISPSSDQKNATIWADITSCWYLSGALFESLKEAISLADDIAIVVPPNTQKIRISLGVLNVWSE